MARPRIAIVSAEDTRSRRAWSGTPYYMAHALQEHCGDVVHLGPARSLVELAGKVRNRVTRTLLGRGAPYQHAPAVARDHARIFHGRLRAAGDVDLIFAPAASTQIAMLETDVPIVYTSDTTFRLMRDYYPGFTGLSDAYAAGGNAIERSALQRAAAVVYPSEWAARSAREHYGVPADRVHVIPYGANLDEVPDRASIEAAKRDVRPGMLFLGVDWTRKGGPIAYEAVRALRARGLDATLTVCGCVPPPEHRAPWVQVIPRLDKSIPAERQALSQLLLEAGLLLLPARQECYGIVFCEASAHGTPSVATDTGGIAGALRADESGLLLPADAPPEAYADAIESLLRDGVRYHAMVASSRAHFEARANWDAWGRRMAELLVPLVG